MTLPVFQTITTTPSRLDDAETFSNDDGQMQIEVKALTDQVEAAATLLDGYDVSHEAGKFLSASVGIYKGDYDTGTTYALGDRVSVGDLLFISEQNGNLNNSTGDTAWWASVILGSTDLGKPFIDLGDVSGTVMLNVDAYSSFELNLAGVTTLELSEVDSSVDKIFDLKITGMADWAVEYDFSLFNSSSEQVVVNFSTAVEIGELFTTELPSGGVFVDSGNYFIVGQNSHYDIKMYTLTVPYSFTGGYSLQTFKNDTTPFNNSGAEFTRDVWMSDDGVHVLAGATNQITFLSAKTVTPFTLAGMHYDNYADDDYGNYYDRGEIPDFNGNNGYHLDDSGNYLLVINSNGKVHQINYGAPFEFSNVSSVDSVDLSADSLVGERSIFKRDDTNFYIIGGSGSNLYLYHYTMTGGDISTASLSATKVISVINYALVGSRFTPDGTRFYFCDSTLNLGGIYYITLSTAWDISTASGSSTLFLTSHRARFFNWFDSGNKLVTTEDNDFYKSYDLSTPYTGTPTAVINIGSFYNQQDVHTEYLSGTMYVNYVNHAHFIDSKRFVIFSDRAEWAICYMHTGNMPDYYSVKAATYNRAIRREYNGNYNACGFANSGMIYWILDDNSTVYTYDLDAAYQPWTADYTTQKSKNTAISQSYGAGFSEDGYSFYITGQGNDPYGALIYGVWKFTMTDLFDVTTSSYSGLNFDTEKIQDTSRHYGVFSILDSLGLFIVNDHADKYVRLFEYTDNDLFLRIVRSADQKARLVKSGVI